MTNGVDGGPRRYLVLLEEDSAAAAVSTFERVAGLRPASTADVLGTTAVNLLSAPDGMLLHDLGVAVVTAAADQADALTRAAGERGPLALVEPERTVHAYTAPAVQTAEVDETAYTWGLRAVGAPDSTATGAGVRVAVLDTGVVVAHPDLAGRTLVTNSFVDGETVDDEHGHGTHCIGTACGPRTPETGPGYGLAHGAEIYAGKVLGNSGSGTDGGILAGLQWAISNRCAVVSMSLGAATRPGDPHSRIFETVASRALRQGTLIVAAAGNESERASGHIAPVGHPANCPSILAVGAIDAKGAVAGFSCGTVEPHNSVDLAGPGVDVYSSWTMPDRYTTISGTSMATPHVAGVAALLAQANGARGWELWARLGQSARRLPVASTDVGAGLVQAP
ncbi:S8 family serine peptidase [Prauserella cavernicola]|uniref:S8 family serine peptidase n=1 Tax=Prauserella cavernicola TaxID=2800127 RepID=A0A934QM74_9PSEU|nr:S8 family serine peptidase [Prauserella cavernicola]MBK1782916.1 S8 family serine peptidase [Prauserella cavernicola]